MGALSRIELVRALAELRRERTRGTVVYYIVLAAFLLFLATIPVCGATQTLLARAHHLRPASTVSWSIGQVVPKMYSFSHRVWRDYQPPDAFGPARWINHYPGRLIRSEWDRANVVGRGKDIYLLVRTGYLGRRWVTRYTVRVHDGGLVVEAAEERP